MLIAVCAVTFLMMRRETLTAPGETQSPRRTLSDILQGSIQRLSRSPSPEDQVKVAMATTAASPQTSPQPMPLAPDEPAPEQAIAPSPSVALEPQDSNEVRVVMTVC